MSSLYGYLFEAYLVDCGYSGEKVIIRDKEKAEEKARLIHETNHNWKCVQKKLDIKGTCLCSTSNGLEECAAHHYQRNVKEHSLKDWPIDAPIVSKINIY